MYEGDGNLSTPQALDRFLAGVERRAYRMAMIATANQDDALDIIQDAMLKLAHKYSNRSESEWGPLFHRILQNTIMDWHRRQKVRNTWISLAGFKGMAQNKQADKQDTNENYPANGSVDGFAHNDSVSPVARLANERSLEAVDGALHKLPLRQQQAFLLRAWEGMSVRETANAMNCSQGSVKTHYSRAVHALRDQLEDYR